jgi:hypothetical protein
MNSICAFPLKHPIKNPTCTPKSRLDIAELDKWKAKCRKLQRHVFRHDRCDRYVVKTRQKRGTAWLAVSWKDDVNGTEVSRRHSNSSRDDEGPDMKTTVPYVRWCERSRPQGLTYSIGAQSFNWQVQACSSVI